MAGFRHVFLFIFWYLVYNGKFRHADGLGLEEFHNTYFHFPYGSPYMGILTAFALPLEINTPGSIFMAVNFEASYSLPENQTEFSFPPIIGSTTRQLLYDIFERKLESHGYPGKPCMLRAICESAELSTAGTGVLGDIVHIILSPSATLNTNLTQEYKEAETQATKKGRCKKYRKSCSFSILKMFSWAGSLFNTDGSTNNKSVPKLKKT